MYFKMHYADKSNRYSFLRAIFKGFYRKSMDYIGKIPFHYGEQIRVWQCARIKRDARDVGAPLGWAGLM